jgi:hypothetical protein
MVKELRGASHLDCRRPPLVHVYPAHAQVRTWHTFSGRLPGRGRQLYPGISDINLLCDFKGVIDLDTQVPHCALNSMARWP